MESKQGAFRRRKEVAISLTSDPSGKQRRLKATDLATLGADQVLTGAELHFLANNLVGDRAIKGYSAQDSGAFEQRQGVEHRCPGDAHGIISLTRLPKLLRAEGTPKRKDHIEDMVSLRSESQSVGTQKRGERKAQAGIMLLFVHTSAKLTKRRNKSKLFADFFQKFFF